MSGLPVLLTNPNAAPTRAQVEATALETVAREINAASEGRGLKVTAEQLGDYLRALNMFTTIGEMSRATVVFHLESGYESLRPQQVLGALVSLGTGEDVYVAIAAAAGKTGLIEIMAAAYVPHGGEYKDVFAFIILIAVLYFMPTGIMGENVDDTRV